MAASKSWPPIDLTAHLGRFFAARSELTGTLCVGFSGGRDSVVLLHALSRLGLANPLMAMHVHHGLSPRADDWVAHCRRLCAEWNVTFSVVQVQVERGAGLGLEAAARRARYRAFAACPAQAVLLAHHRGDQAETLLFNLLRGSGLTGAASMPVERDLAGVRLLRPLLEVAPQEIEAYARHNQLVWVEDESNDDTAFSRNFLRHQVMPGLEARFPGASRALARAAGHFAEAQGLLDDLAEMDWQICAAAGGLRLAAARRLSAARLNNLLRWRLRQLGWQVPVAARLDEFVRQLRSARPDRHPSLALPEGEMRVGQGCLIWTRC
ncbi:MAG: tRNA(Ile)-lysidine synthase [Betaproteobacteria bacterium ADurb.Bin341]|nr:MAG: tRNA(Ile)-lysidine synthase [Betaproteobacteria bacterium ADurb.Bin341]